MKYVCILFAVILLFSCANQPAPKPKTAVDVLNAIPEIKPPLELVDGLFWVMDTTTEFSEEEFMLLELKKIVNPDWWEHFKYIPVRRFSLHQNYITVLLFQYYTEEMYGKLINYTKEGKLVNRLVVYEWNAEGASGKYATITIEKEIIIKSANIYENDGKTVTEIMIINDEGHFIPKPK